MDAKRIVKASVASLVVGTFVLITQFLTNNLDGMSTGSAAVDTFIIWYFGVLKWRDRSSDCSK